MFPRVADKEPGWDTAAVNEQVQFEHVLDCISMLVVESGHDDATVLDLKDLDLEVLFDSRHEFRVDEGFTACSGIN